MKKCENEIIDSEFSTENSIELSGMSVDYLLQISQWTLFIAIIGFIFISLLFLIAVSVLFFLNDNIGLLRGGGTFIFYLLIYLFFFFPLFHLFQFSRKTKKAIADRSGAEFQGALDHLMSHYKGFGILLTIFTFYFIMRIFLF